MDQKEIYLKQIKKLLNRVLVPKYEQYIDHIDVDFIEYRDDPDDLSKSNIISVTIYVTKECAKKLYDVWLRFTIGGSYQDFVNKGSVNTMSHLFIDDVLNKEKKHSWEFISQIQDIVNYVSRSIHVVHPLYIEFPQDID